MEENFGTKNNSKARLRAVITFIILFVLPLGTWVFMSTGLDYRKDSVSELNDLGKILDFDLKNQNAQAVSPELLQGRVAVVNFLSDDKAMAKKQTSRIAKVHQSYNDTDDVVFLSIIKSDTSTDLLGQATSLGISDHQQWFLLGADQHEWQDLSSNTFKISNTETGVALLDTSMTIRNHYDIYSNPEMGRLVEHISIVIPKQARRSGM